MTNDQSAVSTSTPHPVTGTTPAPLGPTRSPNGRGNDKSDTDTVAAATVAVVAVIIVLTIIFVSRALIKRRRARQGERMDQPIPAISTGIMGTPVNVYANVQRQPGGIQWEPVTPLPSTNQNVAQQPRDTSSEQYNLPPPGSTGNLDSVL